MTVKGVKDGAKWGDYKLDLKPRNKNQTDSAGITAREAKTIYALALKLSKIRNKKNLFRGFVIDIDKAIEALAIVLINSGRLEK